MCIFLLFVDWFCRWEFIQHVLSSKPYQFDEHFRPIYLLCSTCSYDFNYILHYEKISIEEPNFVQHLGAEGDFLDAFGMIKSFLFNELLLIGIIKSKWENSNKGNITKEQLIEAYFGLLSNNEIKRLYEIYRLDFKQFNYTFTFRGITYNDLNEQYLSN